MEDNSGYYSESENRFIEAPKRQWFRLQIPYSLRFGIIWTLFFVIIGIVIQSIQANAFVLVEFFGSNYISWFKSFGTFTDITIYPGVIDVVYALLRHWYYFFVTGGYLSLLWGIISLIIHWEVVFKAPEKKPQEINPKPIESKPIIKEKIVEKIVEKPVSKPAEQPKPAPQPSLIPTPIIPARALGQKDIIEWLEEGYLFLADGNVKKAELIYNHVKRAYDPMRDPGQVAYKRILDFYDQILDEKKHPGLNKEIDTWEG